MKTLKTLSSLAMVGLVAWSGCSKDSGANATPGASQGSEATPAEASQSSGKMAALSDGQILQVLANVDTGEIEQAQVALSKAGSPAVREFAQHMIDQHTQAKQEGQQLSAKTSAAPAVSEPAEEVHTKATAALQKLKSADATSFDATYIEGQVQQHQDVLKMLNEKLIPSASSSELRMTLEKTKSMVEHHIEMAKGIRP
jgi:putative membrane protein